MNKSSKKLTISITSEHEIMISQLLTLISNSKFQKSGDIVTVNVIGTMRFDFENEDIKIMLESKN